MNDDVARARALAHRPKDDAAEVAFIAVVVFVRGGGPGAVLDLTHPACLRLARIEDEGPIATYNEGASASRRLFSGARAQG